LTAAGKDPPADLDALRTDVSERLDRFDITGALEAIWHVVRRLNQYVEESAPWQLAKDEARAAELDTVLANLADGLVAVAVALASYLPDTAPRILEALKQPADLSWGRVGPGAAEATEGIEPAQPLFPRIELPTAAA
ncbi:MAG: methionyl-tRNA synthetase, partial [Gaiellaceae bacterium]|nr:methionyl-tRNA synthetase [Gaiellaceae bacterium]